MVKLIQHFQLKELCISLPRARTISSTFIWSIQYYLVTSTTYRAPHYGFFFSILLLLSTRAKYFVLILVYMSNCILLLNFNNYPNPITDIFTAMYILTVVFYVTASYSLVDTCNVSEESDTSILWVKIVKLLINSHQTQIFIVQIQFRPYPGCHNYTQKQVRQYTYNVTLRRFRITIFAVETQ